MFSTEEDFAPADYDLLTGSGVTLFRKPRRFARACRRLAALGYEILPVDCAAGSETFRTQLSQALRRGEQFGSSAWTGATETLADCFDWFPPPEVTQSAFAFARFDVLAKAEPALAWRVLDVIASQSRRNLLLGKRVLALVQSDDPAIAFAPVGAQTVQWNGQELSPQRRGLATQPPAATPAEARAAAFVTIIENAFPWPLRDRAQAIGRMLLPLLDGTAKLRTIEVRLDSEHPDVPRRLPLRELPPRSREDDEQWAMVQCLLTRHPDGHVRAAAARAIMGRDDRWVRPFVLLAAGDRVPEVAAAVAAGLPGLERAHYAELVRHNRPLVRRLRVAAEAVLADHPAIATLREMERWAA